MDRIAFSGNDIDRLGELRADPHGLQAALDDAETRFLPVWRDRCLVRGERVALLTRDEIGPAADDSDRRTLLGSVAGRTVFCAAADRAADRPHAAGNLVDLREVFSHVSDADAALFAYAKAMSSWQDNHRHCGVCGSPNRLLEAGFVMECTQSTCRHRSFPRLDPAIIVLVRHGDRCLLGRKADWPRRRFSTVAGFVEPGESLEDALRREVREETNVGVGACRYMASQPWPFPAALMIGFHADATSTDIACNDAELAEARWITREQLIDGDVVLPPRISIAYRLIETWFDDYAGPTLSSLNLPAPPLRAPRPVD